jgi:hypothetical protein
MMKPEDFLKKTKAMERNMKNMKSSSVVVGVMDDARYPNGTSVAEVGYYQEYGIGVDQNSFLRQPFIEKQSDLNSNFNQHFQDMVDDGNINQLMQKVGETAVQLVNDAFESKGFGKWSNDLKDTELLKNSISSKVRNK